MKYTLLRKIIREALERTIIIDGDDYTEEQRASDLEKITAKFGAGPYTAEVNGSLIFVSPAPEGIVSRGQLETMLDAFIKANRKKSSHHIHA